jgi:hypothetical protein
VRVTVRLVASSAIEPASGTLGDGVIEALIVNGVCVRLSTRNVAPSAKAASTVLCGPALIACASAAAICASDCPPLTVCA